MVRLTSYGVREIGVTFVLAALGVLGFLHAGHAAHPLLTAGAAVPAALFLLILYFFRDPERTVPLDPGLLVSPADGVVTHVEELDEPSFLQGKALRVSIFLSVFDVHLNRAPCAGTVAFRQYRKGDFVNAMRADSSHLNEANDVGIETGDPRAPRVLVRQIAGLIARRIVCEVGIGDTVERGARYGMIKFSSRTELYVPAAANLRLRVKVGDVVRAGATVIGDLP